MLNHIASGWSQKTTKRGIAMDLKPETAKNKLPPVNQRPATGRTTALGRKVEKPGIGNPAGPSGQKAKGPQDRKHANK